MRLAHVLCCIVAASAIAGCQSSALAPQTSANRLGAALRASGSPASQGGSQQSIWTIAAYVYQYSFSGQQLSELQGFSAPVGLCTDPSGDVYVVDEGRQEVFVYAPGQSLPFYIYDDLGETPNSCAFDPTTGNLAVANSANLTIFPPASGTPLVYTTSKMKAYSYLGYDKSGDLYIDGEGIKGGFALAELPAGRGGLINVTVSLTKGKHRAGGLVWDGQDLAISDPLSTVIYRIAVSESSGKILDTWHIANWKLHYTPVFAIDGKRLLFPGHSDVEFFSYPPKGRAKSGFSGNVGNVLTIGPEVIN
jgi:DNA-binding beta-propeller fold protein YncE